jgi:lipid-binding SYLF domain-containing protein
MATIKIVLFSLILSSFSSAEKTSNKIDKRFENAAQVLQEIINAPDKGIPQEVIEHAKCIAVIPHEIKAGFIVGVRQGKGVVTCRSENGWSAPALFTITGGSWGAQVGIEGVDNVLMIMNQKGMDRLLSDKFEIGADASAAAGPIGRHAEAGTDWKLDAEILSYSRAKGVFAGATLNGAVVRPDKEAMQALYGPSVTAHEVLSGNIPPPAEAQPFLVAVRSAEREARAAS